MPVKERAVKGFIPRAEKVRKEIYRILQGEYPDDPKTMIALGWLDLAMEHHEAIIQLARERLYGSAFSLVRGVFELMFKAHWVVGCATLEEAEKISRKDNFDFPETGVMVKAVDEAFATGSHFADIKKQGWKAMNSYAHGGLLQLTRRFSAGRVEPNYKDSEIEEVVNATSAAILNFALLLTASSVREQQAREIEDLMTAFAADKL
jgi:hypothetical protein